MRKNPLTEFFNLVRQVDVSAESLRLAAFSAGIPLVGIEFCQKLVVIDATWAVEAEATRDAARRLEVAKLEQRLLPGMTISTLEVARQRAERLAELDREIPKLISAAARHAIVEDWRAALKSYIPELFDGTGQPFGWLPPDAGNLARSFGLSLETPVSWRTTPPTPQGRKPFRAIAVGGAS